RTVAASAFVSILIILPLGITLAVLGLMSGLPGSILARGRTILNLKIVGLKRFAAYLIMTMLYLLLHRRQCSMRLSHILLPMRQPSIHCARKRSALAIFNPLEVFDDNHFHPAEVNLFDLSRQFFFDLSARVFLSFVESLNLGMKFLRDLLAVRENQAVAIVGIHPDYPAFRFWLRRLFLKYQLDPQSATSLSQSEGLGDLPTVRNELIDGRNGAKRRGQARRSGTDKYSGKIELFALKFFQLQKMIEERYGMALERGFLSFFSRLFSLGGDYFHRLLGNRLAEPCSNSKSINGQMN